MQKHHCLDDLRALHLHLHLEAATTQCGSRAVDLGLLSVLIRKQTPKTGFDFGLAVLTLAGLWPLYACRIVGLLDVSRIPQLLPTSVEYLHLNLDSMTFDVVKL